MENEKRLIEIPEDGVVRIPIMCGDATVGERCIDLSHLPTVDAMEVVHGHWCWEGRFKACSECGSYVEWDETLGANFWKFCPYCGAKMDKEAKE